MNRDRNTKPRGRKMWRRPARIRIVAGRAEYGDIQAFDAESLAS